MPDKNFLMASDIIKNLSLEISSKNQKINELQNENSKLKDSFEMNQTFW